MNDKETKTKKPIRCAIYTRKSTEEGLDQEFNSLDAQRASAEAFIASQMHEGWTVIPTEYDDGGFTGGNMDRPSLKRLMEPVEILAPPPIHKGPRLPPDHPYHVPPGYSAPDNLPPGHPGEYYPDMPPDPVIYPVEEDTDSVGDESQS